MADEYPGLFASPCGYFDGRTSHYTVFSMPSPEDACGMFFGDGQADARHADPETCQQAVFDTLLEQGFRRADSFAYRADCPDCRRCIPIRIKAAGFAPSKTQRHTLRSNSDISLSITSEPASFISGEKAALYSIYDKRHNPGTAKPLSSYRDELMQMNGVSVQKDTEGKGSLSLSFSGTINMEYRLRTADGSQGKLIGVGIVDAGTNSLSSNYFYYDISPETMKRSIGTYSILREIELCTRLNLEWYYLGYWLADCRKMVYKARFKPHQLLRDGIWKDAET